MRDTRTFRSITSFLSTRLGPGLIVSCVVIGPGSIMTSSKIGAEYGYQLVWVLVIAALLMMTYMNLGARLGVVARATPGDLVAEFCGRWLTLVIGLSVFSITSAYQFGNNLGVASAMDGLLQEGQAFSIWAKLFLLLLCNTLAIGFLFIFKNLYKRLEQLMTVFVGIMLLAFLLNLFIAKPNLASLATGLIPSLPEGESTRNGWIPVIAWIGTTFITVVAYYQAYLVRQKGWDISKLSEGINDARLGTIILATITLTIMATAGAQLQGKDLLSPAQVAQQLKPLFGTKGQFIFCIGLFSAAYSSFLVNSMLGGFMLSDGLGFGTDPNTPWPRRLSALVLLIGMGIGMVAVVTGKNPVGAIVFAQALTVIAAPLTGGVLWWLTSRKDIMGIHVNRLHHHVGAAIGFFILLSFSVYLVVGRILPTLGSMQK